MPNPETIILWAIIIGGALSLAYIIFWIWALFRMAKNKQWGWFWASFVFNITPVLWLLLGKSNKKK